MSLDFDFSAIKNRSTKEEWEHLTTSPATRGLGEGRQWHPVADAMIWLCVGLDMSGITEANIDEFCWRLNIYQKLHGAHMMGRDGPIYVVRSDVEKYVGMWTNVSQKSRKAWLTRTLDRVRECRNDEVDLRDPDKKLGAFEITELLWERHGKKQEA